MHVRSEILFGGKKNSRHLTVEYFPQGQREEGYTYTAKIVILRGKNMICSNRFIRLSIQALIKTKQPKFILCRVCDVFKCGCKRNSSLFFSPSSLGARFLVTPSQYKAYLWSLCIQFWLNYKVLANDDLLSFVGYLNLKQSGS